MVRGRDICDQSNPLVVALNLHFIRYIIELEKILSQPHVDASPFSTFICQFQGGTNRYPRLCMLLVSTIYWTREVILADHTDEPSSFTPCSVELMHDDVNIKGSW